MTKNDTLYINLPEDMVICGYSKDGTPIVQKITDSTNIYEILAFMGVGAILGICLYLVRHSNLSIDLKTLVLNAINLISNSTGYTDKEKVSQVVGTTNAALGVADTM